MILRLIIIGLCCVCVSTAQTREELDSIKQHVYTMENDTNKAIAMLNLFTQYYDHDNDISLSLAEDGLKLSQEIDFKKGEAKALNKMGNTFYRYKNFSKAMQYFEQSLALSISIKEPYWTAINYRHIGGILHERGQWEEGVQYQHKGLKIHLAMNDIKNISQCYNRISVFYRESMDIDSALLYSTKSINIASTLKKPTVLANAYRNKAIIHLAVKDFKQSEKYFNKAITLQKKHSPERELTFSYSKYAQLLLQQKKYSQAIYYFKNSIASTEKMKILKDLPVLYESLALAQQGEGQYEEALNTYAYFTKLNDSLHYLSEQLAIAAHEADIERFNTHQEKLLLQEKQKQNRKAHKKRKSLTYILIVVLFVLILLTINAVKKEQIIKQITHKEQEEESIKFEQKIHEEQLKASEQIIENHESTKVAIAKELHDGLAGTLAAVRVNLIHLQETNNCNALHHAEEGLTSVIENVRNLSHSLISPSLKGHSFSTVMQDFILHHFTDPNINLTVNIFPKKTINKLEQKIKLTVYRIVQELCANITLYSQANTASISLIAHDTYLNILIEDNGKGLNTKTDITPNKGIALCYERLKLLQGEMHIENNKNSGTIIDISIPLSKTNSV